MDYFKLQALEFASSWIIGPLTLVVMQGLKRYVRWVESRPVWTKRALVVATSAALTALGAVLGVEFGVTGESVAGLAALPTSVVTTALGAAVAMVLHAMKRAIGARGARQP